MRIKLNVDFLAYSLQSRLLSLIFTTDSRSRDEYQKRIENNNEHDFISRIYRDTGLYVRSNPIFRISTCHVLFRRPIKEAIINMQPKTIYELENQTEIPGFNAA